MQCSPDKPAPSKRELTAALEAKLPAYMVPKVLVFIDTFPVTGATTPHSPLIPYPTLYPLPSFYSSLYPWLRPSLRPSLHPSLHPSLRPSANGKLDRKALQVPHKEAFEDESPGSQHETAVLALFREFLNPSVSLNDGFFEVGGSSLRAMQLSVKLRREYGVSLGKNRRP